MQFGKYLQLAARPLNCRLRDSKKIKPTRKQTETKRTELKLTEMKGRNNK